MIENARDLAHSTNTLISAASENDTITLVDAPPERGYSISGAVHGTAKRGA